MSARAMFLSLVVFLLASIAIAQDPFATLTVPTTLREHSVAKVTCDAPLSADVIFTVSEVLEIDYAGRKVKIFTPVPCVDFSTSSVRQWGVSGPPGVYQLRIDCAAIEKNKIKRFVDVVFLTIEPTKKPDPDISPEDEDDDDKDPTDPVPSDWNSLTKDVATWIPKKGQAYGDGLTVPADQFKQAEAIAKTFSEVARRSDPPGDLYAMVLVTAEAYRKSLTPNEYDLWRVLFFDKIEEAVLAADAAGKLSTAADRSKCWEAIAAGLSPVRAMAGRLRK